MGGKHTPSHTTLYLTKHQPRDTLRSGAPSRQRALIPLATESTVRVCVPNQRRRRQVSDPEYTGTSLLCSIIIVSFSFVVLSYTHTLTPTRFIKAVELSGRYQSTPTCVLVGVVIASSYYLRLASSIATHTHTHTQTRSTLHKFPSLSIAHTV